MLRAPTRRKYPRCCNAWIVILSLVGCRHVPRDVEVWIVGDSRGAPPSFTEEASTLAGDQRIGRVDLAGALNETLSFRFAVRASAALVAPDICVAPLRSVDSRIDASAITVFRVHPVSIRDWPGWHLRYVNPNARNANPLDVLVLVRAPRDGLPAVMLPSETYHFWVDIVVPKGTDAGLFTTTIKLTSAGVFVGGVTVRLTVWPFLLPDAAGVPIIAELDHRKLFRHHVRYRGRPHGVGVDDWRDDPLRSELDALLASTLRMLRQNRLTPVLPELNPIVKVTAHDSVVVDWGQYDAVVEPCFDGRAFFSRVAIPVWPLPLGGVRPPHPADAAARQYKSDLMQAYVGQCAAHFARNDWLDRTYAVAPPRSWLDPKAAKITRGFASMLAGTNVRTASRLFPQDLAPYGWTDFTYTDMSEAVDIWMSPAQFFSKARMAAEREAGRRTWVAVDRPPFSGSVSIHASPSDVRVLSWQAEELAAQALHIGSVNDWPDADDSPSPQDCVDRDPRVLIYPGGPFGLDHPVPSARLMYLRRTAQDDAYFRLLREHGLGHLVATLVGSLCPYAGADAYRTHFADGRTVGWPDDVGLFDDARRIMANELIRVANDVCHDEPRKQFVRGAEWRRLMMRTRQLKVRVDGTRVRAIGTRTAPGFEIECALTITNSSRVPVSGSVRFTELPSGWESSGEHPIRRLAPGDSLRVKL
ncbi:MAG: hypothetical protein ACE5HE_01035, partial [Phycisphaerae bacterium]